MSSRPFRPQDIVFFGATTASVSHELKNVVTIINETAGLLHDFTLAADRGRPLDVARVRKISTNITGSVTRAVEILNRLNRFAHSTDEPVHTFELNRLVRDVVALAERGASVQGVALEAELPDAPVWVASYAFGLHQLIALGLRAALLGAAASTTVRLTLARDAQGPAGDGVPAARVAVSPIAATEDSTAADTWAQIESLAHDLGATVCKRPIDDGVDGLQIWVPEVAAGALT